MAVTNIPGPAAAGANATGQTGQDERYVVPHITAHVGYVPPPASNAVAIPAIRTASLAHSGSRGISARNAPFSPQGFIDSRSSEPVSGISRPNRHDRAAVRKFFVDQSRDDDWKSEVTKQAPTLSADQQKLVVEEMIARNVMRYANSGDPNDGFKRLNALGYFLALYAAHRHDNADSADSAEVRAARAVYARIAQEMVESGGRTSDGKPKVSLSAAHAFLNKAGDRLNASTKGWQDELPKVQQLARAAVLPSPSIDIASPNADHRTHHADGGSSPLRPAYDAHAAFARATAEADREQAYVDGQKRAITAALVAARRAVNGSGRPLAAVSGPLASAV